MKFRFMVVGSEWASGREKKHTKILDPVLIGCTKNEVHD